MGRSRRDSRIGWRYSATNELAPRSGDEIRFRMGAAPLPSLICCTIWIELNGRDKPVISAPSRFVRGRNEGWKGCGETSKSMKMPRRLITQLRTEYRGSIARYSARPNIALPEPISIRQFTDIRHGSEKGGQNHPVATYYAQAAQNPQPSYEPVVQSSS